MICKYCLNEYSGYRTSKYCTPLCSVMSKTEKDSDSKCINFTGNKCRFGYGTLRFRGIDMKTHRAVWECHNGKIPEDKIIRHKCDNPSCCNIDHLAIGSHAENSKDMTDRNRQAYGVKNGSAKLNDDLVREIRILRDLGMGLSELGRQYGVTPTAIQSIEKRKSWKHVP